MFDGIVLVLSGLVVWKSVQFLLLRELMGGYDTARYVHFLAMASLVGFVVLPGIYAGGDCEAPGQDLTVQAVQHGKLAALAIHADLLTKLEAA